MSERIKSLKEIIRMMDEISDNINDEREIGVAYRVNKQLKEILIRLGDLND